MRPEVDLLRAGLLPPLPAALLAGEDADLLAPLRMWTPSMPWPENAAAPIPASGAVSGGSSGDPRAALAEGLAAANRNYGHARAEDLGRRLADPSTGVVVTGQQPGVLGGPLYTLTKAIAAVRLAECMTADGRPTVAVFWVHTEDHDFAEIARTAVLAPAGPLELSLGADEAPLRPVGMRRLGTGVDELLARIREAVPGDGYHRWLDEMGGMYRAEAGIGEAFCRLLVRLLGDRCPLLLDGMLPTVKRAQVPWLERLVERRSMVAERLQERSLRVTERGYRLQVRSQPETAPFFLLRNGERRRVLWDGDGYALRGLPAAAGGTIDEILRLVRDEPERISPSALARPAVQDAILGTTVQVLGPGELAYMTQAAGTHEALGIAPPGVALRPQVVILGRKQVGWLEASGVGLDEVVARDDRLDAALARELGGDFVQPVRQRIEELLATLDGPAAALDSNLERPLSKTRQQVVRALDTFSGKVAGALASQDQIQRRRLGELRTICRPLGGLQERVISAAHFPGRQGERFVQAMWHLDLAPDRLQAIVPDETPEGAVS